MDIDNVEDVTNELTMDAVETPEIVKETQHTVELLGMIYVSLRSANSQKGGFTFDDIKQMSESYNLLVEFFGKDAHLTTPKEITALDTLLRCCQFQQQTGVFTFEGSIKLLSAFDELTKALNETKTPGQKMADMRKQLGGGGSNGGGNGNGGTKPKNNNNGPKRPQQNNQVKK